MDVGGYTEDKRLLRVEDYHLWYKFYAKGYKGYNIPEALYKMRDDRNALHRRTVKARFNGIYATFVGFKWFIFQSGCIYMLLKMLLLKLLKLLFQTNCIYFCINVD